MPILNDNQRRVTEYWLKTFEQALKDLDEHPRPDVHPLLARAQRDGLVSQIDLLRSDLLAYDNDQKEKMNE